MSEAEELSNRDPEQLLVQRERIHAASDLVNEES